MKQFFKYMLATMCGIILLTLIGALFFGMTVMSLVAGDSPVVKAKENSVFVMKLNGYVSERAEDAGPLTALLGEADMDELGLDDLLLAIKRAKEEENVKGIFIQAGVVSFDAPATAQQLRDALADFRKSGKWVVVYAEQLLQGGYYVCSVADTLLLNKTGMIDFRGLGGKNYYLKGLYDKLGVEYQAARVGRYKSYVESVTREDMSEDDRYQRTTYLQGIWKQWLTAMGESRHVDAQQLDSLASDSIMLFASIDDYMKAGLIDRAIYSDEVKGVVKGLLGLGEDDEVNQLLLEDMLNLKVKKQKDRGEQVAVYYAYGEIVDEPLSGFMSEHAIVGSTTVEDLNELANDKDVKAVVIRVNSGGGSAIASEQIWHAIKQLSAKKPVVVSMGGVAASGGYMISCGASYIMAEPTTITGSIGIFGLVPNFSRLVTDKLGVTWDGVTTNRYGDYETNLIFEKDNAEALQYLQHYTDRGYENFLSIVGEARGMTRDQVHEIAQGRVWLATDALPIKLVDQLGSLDDAVKKAAELAQLDNYRQESYPQKKGWLSSLMDKETEHKSLLDQQLRQTLGDLYEPLLQLRLDQQRNILQARLPFDCSVK